MALGPRKKAWFCGFRSVGFPAQKESFACGGNGNCVGLRGSGLVEGLMNQSLYRPKSTMPQKTRIWIQPKKGTCELLRLGFRAWLSG